MVKKPLPSREQLAEFIATHPTTTRKQLAQIHKISTTTIYRILRPRASATMTPSLVPTQKIQTKKIKISNPRADTTFFNPHDSRWYLRTIKDETLILGFAHARLLTRSVDDNGTETFTQHIANKDSPEETTIEAEHHQATHTFSTLADFLLGRKTRLTHIELRGVLTINFKFFERHLNLKRATKLPRHITTSSYYLAQKNDYILSPEQTLYRVLSVEHYTFGSNPDELFSIVPFFRSSAKDTPPRPLIHPRDILVSYDIETTEFAVPNDSDYNLLQQPYLMYACVDFNHADFLVEPIVEYFIHDDLSTRSTIAQQFVQFIISLVDQTCLQRLRPCIRIFGYNNYRFDDNFIHREFMRLGRMTASGRNNKRSNTTVWINGIQIKFNDLVTWIPDMSLAQACTDYEVQDSKMAEVDIIAYNRASTRLGRLLDTCPFTELDTYLKIKNNSLLKIKIKKAYLVPNSNNLINIRQYIIDYCKYDTLATMEIFKKIEQTVVQIFERLRLANINFENTHFLEYRSVAQISGLIIRKSLAKQEQLRLKIEDARFGSFIHSSCFGGRVDFSCIGEYTAHSNSIRMEDVTSQYTQAMTAFYPRIESNEDLLVGEHINLAHYQRILDTCAFERARAFDSRTLHDTSYMQPLDTFKAILFCDIFAPSDDYNLCTFAPVGVRVHGDKRIEYLNTDQKGRVLNTVQMKNLLLVGFRILLRPHKHNTIFLRTAQIFNEFVSLLGQMKIEARQADKKTQAKFLKLFLNSAAGKLAQQPQDTLDEFKSSTLSSSESLQVHHTRSRATHWENSMHYLFSCLASEANFLLFYTLYMLELDYVYARQDLTFRCGTLLYMDTDSIAFDVALASSAHYTFEHSEEIGFYDPTLARYRATWKCKLDQANSICIIAKKSYLLYDTNKKPLIVKLKGIHSHLMQQIALYSNCKSILDGNPFKLQTQSLSRTNTQFPMHDQAEFSADTNRPFQLSSLIAQVVVKKTCSRAVNFSPIIPHSLDHLNAQNKIAYNRLFFNETVRHFLVFTASPSNNEQNHIASRQTQLLGSTDPLSILPSK